MICDILVGSKVYFADLPLLPEDLVEGLVKGCLGVRFSRCRKFGLALRTLIVGVDTVNEIGTEQSWDLDDLPRTDSRD